MLSRDAEEQLRTLAPLVLGTLVRRYGQFETCEDAVQEALFAAAVQWPAQGVPENPRGWLLAVATRRLTDAWRSESARRDRERALGVRGPGFAPAADEPTTQDADDSLLLLFLCCHPALAPSAQVALTLRAVGGLSTTQIAHAFLTPEATMSQRIRRAKQRLAGERFAAPTPAERDGRLAAVLHILYLIFNEGYAASGGPQLQRAELTGEAIRLTRQLHRLLPGDGEVAGLLALMLLTDAHRLARTGPHGELIPLAEQDRSRWDRAACTEGIALVSAALAGSPPGPYQLQAAIAAVHAEARSYAETDWRQIAALYRLLDHLAPNPMVTLNRAAALAMVDGPQAGLALLEPLRHDPRTARHHRLAAVRAHLLELAGARSGAHAEYLAAARLTTSAPEQRYLLTRAARLGGSRQGGPMTEFKTDTLRVPGATLHYEVRGGGPALLLIGGGVYDAAGLTDLADALAGEYTVVTYDRRGNSRSPLDGPPGPQAISEHADDAERLLAAVAGDEPAYVFGNSSGAQIALELTLRHPERVRAVVAHEPPYLMLLPDAERRRELLHEVEATFHRDGPGAAMALFGTVLSDAPAAECPSGTDAAAAGTGTGEPLDAAQADEGTPAMPPRFAANVPFFVGYEVPRFGVHLPDLAALRAVPARVVVAVGAETGGPLERISETLADALGVDMLVLPGDHGGFGAHPGAYATALRTVFSEEGAA